MDIEVLGTYGEGRGEGKFFMVEKLVHGLTQRFLSQQKRQVEILESVLLWREAGLLYLEGLLSPQGSKSQICWDLGAEFRLGSRKKFETFLQRTGIKRVKCLLLSIKDHAAVLKH